jgi:hypothetical protein
VARRHHPLADAPDRPAGAAGGAAASPSSWAAAAGPALWRSLAALWKLAAFVIPLMLSLELLRQLRLQERLERAAAPLARWLRLPPSLTPALLAGLLLGVATGAAVIDQALEATGGVDRRALWRLNAFLLLFHSLVEDTLMFALFPVPIAAVATIRLTAALLVARAIP